MPVSSTTDRRRALSDMVRERSTRRQGGRGILWAIGVLLAILLAGLLAWLLGFFSTPGKVLEIRGLVDAQIVELRQAASTGQFTGEPSPGFAAILDDVRDLPPEIRRQAGREIGRLFEAREQAETDSYFNLPPERRQAELDRRIKADEERRQAREAARAQRESRQSAGTGGGPRPGGSGSGGPPASGRRGRSSTEEERNARRKVMIDRTSPQERARRTEYRRAIDERRKQLGLPVRGGRW
jgi:hypothetical protein